MTDRMTAMLVGLVLLTAMAFDARATRAAIQTADTPPLTSKVEISGTALGFGTIGAGESQPIQIIIEKWSPPEAREKLIRTFVEKKQSGLLNALHDMDEIGRWRFPGYMGPDPERIYQLGTPIKYAANQPLSGGGTRVVIMTDRIIGFQENREKPRSIDYPFTLMEMHFDKNGTGEGKMAWFTQIKFDDKKKEIGLEYYSSEPVRLNTLKLQTKK